MRNEVTETAWLEWLNADGQANDLAEEGAVSVLLDRLGQLPTAAILIDVCIGKFYDVVGGKVCRADHAETEAAALRRDGVVVHVAAAPRLAEPMLPHRGAAPEPNLYSLCRQRMINRRAVAFQLENISRFGRIVDGGPVASLAEGRRIFQHCLLFWCAAGSPEASALPETPASDKIDQFLDGLDRAPDVAIRCRWLPHSSRLRPRR